MERENLMQICDREQLRSLVHEAMSENCRAVEDYHNGKTAAFRALQGSIMAKTGGRADPILTESLLLSVLRLNEQEKTEGDDVLL